jgi:hypothetical protein
MIPLLARAHAGAGFVRRAVIKARDPYFDRLADEISAAIIRAQGDIASRHVQALLDSLRTGPDGFASAVAVLCNGFRDELGPAVTEDVLDRVLLAYTRGTVDMIQTTRFELNLTDERALAWLGRDVPYWIGEYWSPALAAEISQTLAPSFTGGLSSRELADRMKAALADRFSRSDSYWRGFAATVTTRARNFGLTEGAVRAGFQVGTVDAVIDNTTSAFCLAANGKKVYVGNMVKLRDAIITSADPEAIRQVAPWPREQDVDGIMQQADLLGALPWQFTLPPWHFHCRSVIVFE